MRKKREKSRAALPSTPERPAVDTRQLDEDEQNWVQDGHDL